MRYNESTRHMYNRTHIYRLRNNKKYLMHKVTSAAMGNIYNRKHVQQMLRSIEKYSALTSAQVHV